MRFDRTVLTVSALIGLAGNATAQQVSAPATALMDEVLDIRVTGLVPRQRVTLRALTPDSAGRSWRAEGEFVADDRGEIVLARDSSVAGSYTGVDPMGLVTTMELPDQPGVEQYVPPGLGDVPLSLVLMMDGRVIDSLTIVRHFLAPGVRAVQLFEPGGPIGTLFHPPRAGPMPGVIVLGGSEGGNSAADVAAQLAAHGNVTLALAYFAAETLPRELDQIALEYFARAVTLLRAQPGVDSTAIALLGSSKGAEAALLVAAEDARVRAVVAYAPSSVAWSCICSSPERSSWSHHGAAVPSVPPGRDPGFRAVPGQPQRPVVHYRYRMQDTAAVVAATIRVERINGPVMLVAGGADELWPSAEMARRVRARLASFSRTAADTILIYPDAGHRIGKSYLPAGSTRVAGGRLETGGTPRANALAQAHAWPAVLQFLSTALRH